MGRRSKRKKLILRKLNAGQEVPDQDLIRNGLGRIVEENSIRIQKLKEAQEAEERAAKLKAEAEAKAKKTTPAKKTPRKRTAKTTRKKS